MKKRGCLAVVASVCVILASGQAEAQKTYGPGVTDTEIKIGSTMPLSGPASGFSILGKTEAAYFKKLNDDGGINGRKINLITYDDGYSPPKAVEQTRRLVEDDEVLLLFSSLGTATNSAVQKYLNSKQVPQLFVGSRAAKWNNPKEYPWTISGAPSYFGEGIAYAKYILTNYPNAKIGVIYQNDDFGKDVLNGLKKGLGDNASRMLVATEGYEVTEPTLDSRIVKLKTLGVDVLIDITTPKHGAQVIRKASELNWSPVHIIASVSAAIETVIRPAGIDAAQGIISATYVKDGADPQWADDADVKAFNQFLAKYYPEAGRSDVLVASGYHSAQLLAYVLKQCGDNLTRENVLKQVKNLKGVRTGILLPGIQIDVTPTDYSGMRHLQLMKLEGERWKLIGQAIEVGSN